LTFSTLDVLSVKNTIREEIPMIRIELSEEAKQELVETFKTTSDRRLRDRCQAVLMKAENRTQKAIARDLHVTSRSIYNWLTAYLSAFYCTRIF
jgi:hypothetical protein